MRLGRVAALLDLAHLELEVEVGEVAADPLELLRAGTMRVDEDVVARHVDDEQRLVASAASPTAAVRAASPSGLGMKPTSTVMLTPPGSVKL